MQQPSTELRTAGCYPNINLLYFRDIHGANSSRRFAGLVCGHNRVAESHRVRALLTVVLSKQCSVRLKECKRDLGVRGS